MTKACAKQCSKGFGAHTYMWEKENALFALLSTRANIKHEDGEASRWGREKKIVDMASQQPQPYVLPLNVNMLYWFFSSLLFRFLTLFSDQAHRRWHSRTVRGGCVIHYNIPSLAATKFSDAAGERRFDSVTKIFNFFSSCLSLSCRVDILLFAWINTEQ